jgi:SAM-dependent methyltransferase
MSNGSADTVLAPAEPFEGKPPHHIHHRPISPSNRQVLPAHQSKTRTEKRVVVLAYNLLTDFSPGMIEEARQAVAGHESQFSLQVADVQALPFEDAAFDAAVADYMLYHVPDRPRALAELARVLRPGGHLFACTNGAHNLLDLKALVDQFYPEAANVALSSRSFNLQNGGAQLAPFFADIAIVAYEDALIVTEAQPLIAYIESMPPEYSPSGEAKERFIRHVEEEIARHGAIHIRKETGLFTAAKPS